uniref:Uncharacterized protein n=1 Tax=Pithovirus LCPAC404 TaxID=2506597 RepID=A0A481ZG82_9VIRU|nr:MAG: uncharacterized protein LCPAC404_00950 [Pithovirus LCPAC404]
MNKRILTEGRIEDVLKKNGFYAQERIITNSSCLYIKCLTKGGYLVFVELDESGTVARTGCDFTYIRSDKADLVPYDYRMGCYKTAGNHVAGVAFQCQKGICTLTSGNSQYPTMVNFVQGETCNIKSRSGFISKDPHAYPIVRFSEILADCKLSHKMIAEASMNIAMASYALAHEKLLKLQNTIVNLGNSLTDFSILKDEKTKQLNHSIKSLESIAKKNSCCDSRDHCNEDSEKDAKILDNLARRRSMFTDLIRSCNCIVENGAHVVKICEDINKITDCMKKKYVNLDKVLML